MPSDIKVSTLVAEGVLSVGGVPGTSVVYARTKKGLHLFHAVDGIRNRKIDAYGVQVAIAQVTQGHAVGHGGLTAYAIGIGADLGDLTKDMRAAGWTGDRAPRIRLAPGERRSHQRRPRDKAQALSVASSSEKG